MARKSRSANTASKERTTSEKQGKSQAGSKASGAPFATTISDQLVSDVASFSFAAPVGSQLGLSGHFASNIDDYGIPGIMACRWVPTVGWTDNQTSPVNIAARALMTRVRMANSGRRNYDQSAMMMYVMAIDSAYLWLAHMKRLYGLLSTVSPVSKYLPEHLVRVCGGDYQDIIMNAADFRSYINTYAARLFSLPVPKLPVISRHQDMSANVYLDAETGKAQLYAMVPEALYVYGFDSVTSTAKLSMTTVPYFANFLPTDEETVVTTMTVAQIKSFGETILAPILTTYGEEDFALIGGDILKAYGEEGVYRAQGISDDYAVVPIYDELMLHRIMNSSAYGFNSVQPTPLANTTFDVTVNVANAPISSFLESKPVLSYQADLLTSRSVYEDGLVLNSCAGPMTPQTAIEATAFMTIPTHIDAVANVGFAALSNVGTEYITRYVIYFMDYTGTAPVLHGAVSMVTPFMMVFTYSATAETADLVAANVGDARDKLSLLEQFDFHPILHPYVLGLDADAFTTGTWTRVGASQCQIQFGDLADYTEITPSDLLRIRNIKTLVDLGL